MTTHIDLYAIHRLDRRQPPEQLAAALTAQLRSTDPRDALTRGRIETARAILGDPAKRAAYDARLTEPRPVTEQTLARIAAGAPAPQGQLPAQNAPSAKGTGRRNVLIAAISAIAALLLIVVTAAACSGNDESEPAASDRSSSSSNGPDGSKDGSDVSVVGQHGVPCRIGDTNDTSAVWGTKDGGDSKGVYADEAKTPSSVIVLDKAIALPSQFDRLADFTEAGTGGNAENLQVLQGKVYVGLVDDPTNTKNDTQYGKSTVSTKARTLVAEIDPTTGDVRVQDSDDGTVTSTLRNNMPGGYYRIQAGEGVTIPEQAEGDLPSQVYTLRAAVPFGADQNTVWVLLRGSNKLYQGTLYDTTSPEGTVEGSTIDPSKCSQ